MKYEVKVASDAMTHIASFMNIGSGIKIILKLLPRQFERFQCCYY
jgi:hypothetical protein